MEPDRARINLGMSKNFPTRLPTWTLPVKLIKDPVSPFKLDTYLYDIFCCSGCDTTLMSASLILDELLLEDHPPPISSPQSLFEALPYYRLSPSRSLSNELLSHIFSLASHDYEDHYDAVVIPLRISHVCSHWRQVALLTGSLWTNLILAFPASRPQLSKVIAWLNRSQNYSIDILFDFRDPSWDWEEESHSFRWQDMEAILRLFLPHVRRWRRFELLTDTWAPIFTFLWYTRKVESAPMLETLSLSRCNAYFASKEESFRPIKLKEPIPLFGGLALERLQEVTLTGVHVDWPSSKLHNLTSLNFKYQASDVMPTLNEFITILSLCPNLEQLSIIGWGPQFPEWSSDEENPEQNAGGVLNRLQRSIHLPHLRRFFFGFVDTDYAIKLLSLFQLSDLEEIAFDDVTGGLYPLNPVDATPLLKWVLGDSHGAETRDTELLEILPLNGVHSLHLHSIHADDHIWSRFFSSLHDLRFLAFHNTPNSALLALSPSQSEPLPLPCPLLEHLDCYDLDPSVLADVIASRSASGSVPPLETTLTISELKITSGQQVALINAGVTIITPIEIP